MFYGILMIPGKINNRLELVKEESSVYTIDRVFRILITIGLIAGAVWLLGYLSDVLFPFVMAFLIAYLLNPAVTFVQRKIHGRAVSIVIVLLGVLMALTIFVIVIVPLINKEMSQFGELLAMIMDNKDFAQKAAEYLPPDFLESMRERISKENIVAMIKEEKFWTLAQSVLKKLLPGLWGIIAGAAAFLMAIVGLFITALYLFFLLLDYEKVKLEWESFLPERVRAPVFEFIRYFDMSMSKYFRAQALIASAMGIIFAIGFALIKLPMGILLGLFIGALNMAPYLQLLGLVPAVLLAVMSALQTGASVWAFTGLVLLVFVVAQAIQDIFLTPRIMGRITGLSPAMTLLSISIWGKLLGFLGLIIAIPMTCLVLAYYHRFVDTGMRES